MYSAPVLTNCLAVQGIRRNVTVTPRGTILSLERSIRLTGQKEPSTTKEQIDALLKRLDKLGVGVNDGDATHTLQPERSGALLASAILAPLCLIQHSILSSALERIKDKVRDVSDCIENPGYMGNTEGAKAVSRLMEEIRTAIADCQVSGRALTGPAI